MKAGRKIFVATMPKDVVPADGDVGLSAPERSSAAGEQESEWLTDVPAFRPLATNRTRQPPLHPDGKAATAREGSVSDRQAWLRSIGTAEKPRSSYTNPLDGETEPAPDQPCHKERRLPRTLVPLAVALFAGICVGFVAAEIFLDREGRSAQYLREARTVASSVLSRLEGSVSALESGRSWSGGREVLVGGLDAEARRGGARSGATRLEPNAPAMKPPVTPGDRAVNSGDKAPSVPSATTAGIRMSNVDSTTLSARAEREFLKGQIEGPPGDNAVQTYHEMVALFPDDPVTVSVGERLGAALVELSADAGAGNRWDAVIHYLGLLDTLPAASATRALPRPASTAPSPSERQEKGNLSTPMEVEHAHISEQLPAMGARPQGAAPSMGAVVPSRDANGAIGLVTFARGDAAMRAGDVVSARRFYEIAAMAGVAGAARAVARTYDPEHLRQMAVRGVRGELDAAKHWYRVAIESGDKEANQDLEQLLKALEPGRR